MDQPKTDLKTGVNGTEKKAFKDVNKPNVRMICLCAVACTGKTTYADAIIGLNDKYKTENFRDDLRPVTLCLGQIFRNSLGNDFFKDMTNPHAPEITSNLVKNMVWEFTKIAYNHGRDIIVDGFPRTINQIQWLMSSSYVSMRPVDVEMRFLFANEEDLKERRRNRIQLCKSHDDAVALGQRFVSDHASFVEVHMMAKKFANMNKFSKKLFVKEIEI